MSVSEKDEILYQQYLKELSGKLTGSTQLTLSDPRVRQVLQQKLATYTNRLETRPTELEKWSDALCKREIVRVLLLTGVVESYAISRAIYSIHGEEAIAMFDNAYSVIASYCGQNRYSI